MKKLTDVLSNKSDNYILPFLWMHGEPHEKLREEIARIESCGIKAFCMESRPHPDFGKEKWWCDVDVAMDEARKRGMQVWLLDDKKFPTGYANGWFEQKYPHKSKHYLAQQHMDLIGPAKNISVLITGRLPSDAKILGVYAYPLADTEALALQGDQGINLTESLHENGFVYLDVPAGQWRLFVTYTTQTGGGRPFYANLIDEDSVHVLIDAVYETHYERYSADFGKTFAGFFSDEAELGNTMGYDFHEVLGKPDVQLPWSDALEQALKKRWGSHYAKNLPALWYDFGDATHALRYAYMDEVTQLVKSCFSSQLGKWCECHGVEYIGHVLEDDNSHSRLGCSIGHYFREEAGHHMGGVDVVHAQILPGFTGKTHRWIDWESDGEFFHYGLAKLGSSAGHIDANKKGRAMCEIFGNYGWAEGVGIMRWLTDHMLVRGINHFVPHAFSPTFPDPDCPPHFYAGGHNPQFGFFSQLMHYMNRSAHLLYGGKPLMQAAVLYHGESEWAGQTMLFQKPMRALMQAQLDCDVIPADVLNGEDCTLSDGNLVINNQVYPCLVIPHCEAIPAKTVQFIERIAGNGAKVLFVGERPYRTCEGGTMPSNWAQIGQVVSLETLPLAVGTICTPCITVDGEYPDLRIYTVKQEDGIVCMLFNESITTNVQTMLNVALTECKRITRYDAVNNQFDNLRIENGQIPISLACGESVMLVLENKGEHETAGDMYKQCRARVDMADAWSIEAIEMGDTTPVLTLSIMGEEAFPNINAPEILPNFCGEIRYKTRFDSVQSGYVRLVLPAITDAAEVSLNGKRVGTILGSNGWLDLSAKIIQGENELEIKTANTLVHRQKDDVSFFMQIPPSGMLQPAYLEYWA